MSLFFTRHQQRDLGDTPNQLIPPRGKNAGTAFVTNDSAMRHSAVWACLRLRADLISSMPLCTFRDVPAGPDGRMVKAQVPATPFLLDPAGDGFGLEDWLYSSQLELDRSGNTFGVVTAADAYGFPATVELVQNSQVTVKGRGPTITGYRIAGTNYGVGEVWHERQFTVPGIPLGMSPIAYAAAVIGGYLSAQTFGLDWFANGRIPVGRLKNTAKTLDARQAEIIKRRFQATMENREIFVHGNDWEYDMIAVQNGESQFVEMMEFSVVEIARFFGMPGDLIDAAAQTSSTRITYQNISQRNLQLLIMNIAPTLVRREKTFSRRVLPKPRYAEFDPRSSLLRMDPQTRQTVLGLMIEHRQLTPDEAREEDNRLPLTEADYLQFERLFGKSTPVTQPTRVNATDPELEGALP